MSLNSNKHRSVESIDMEMLLEMLSSPPKKMELVTNTTTSSTTSSKENLFLSPQIVSGGRKKLVKKESKESSYGSPVLDSQVIKGYSSVFAEMFVMGSPSQSLSVVTDLLNKLTHCMDCDGCDVDCKKMKGFILHAVSHNLAENCEICERYTNFVFLHCQLCPKNVGFCNIPFCNRMKIKELEG